MRYQYLLAIPLFLICRFAMPQAMPPNADSEYFRTFGCGTLVNSKVIPADIVFYLNLKVKKSLPEKAVIVVEFENPISKAAPIEVALDPAPDKKELSISSPPMACITNGKYYRAILTLFADSSRSRILDTHVQIIAFFIPAPMFDNLNVPVCPAY